MARDWGALLGARRTLLAGATAGPLQGLEFVAKDVFDVEGLKTGAGNPDFLAEATPATATAPAVRALVTAGATLVGKAITDEFTWSLAGTNPHYGTPTNPRAADRIPGGSSSGSAVAVAGGLVPFSLGTDTAGSVRVPASYCGVFGIRPTHGRVDNRGVAPLAPSYDTVGWFARTGELLQRVGSVLLPPNDDPPPPPKEIVLLTDSFALADPLARDQLLRVAESLASRLGLVARRHHFCEDGVQGWTRMAEAYPKLMAREAWASYGSFLSAKRRNVGSDVAGRFDMASKVTEADQSAHLPVRTEAIVRLRELTRNGALLAVPAAPTVAPSLTTPAADLPALRSRTLAVGIVATLTGAPSVSLPLALAGDLPVGLALIGARGADEHLLRIAAVAK